MATPPAVVVKPVPPSGHQGPDNRVVWLVEPGRFESDRQPLPQVDPEQVLVRIAYCGICPWDVRVYSGKKLVPMPRIMGHEASGVVAAVGEKVKDIEVGQRVVADFIVKCGVCPSCRRGRANRCQAPRFPNGAYEDYAVLPRHNIYAIRQASTRLKSAAFMEPLACVVRGQKMLHLAPGETELVIGAGPIGLMHMQIARLFGARVMVVDLIPERLELAQRLGADAVYNNTGNDMKAAVLEWTDNRGADAAIVTVGASPVVVQTAECMADGGRLNIFAGIYPPTPLAIDPNLIHYRELIITGSADSTPQDMYQALGYIESGQVKVEALISHVLPLEKLAEGFEIVLNRQGLKVMVQVGGEIG